MQTVKFSVRSTDMQKLLVLSPFCAYSGIKHAGGKIHYHYLKKLEAVYAITHIGVAKLAEQEAIAAGGIQADSHIFYKDACVSPVQRLFSRLQDWFTQHNPFDRYAGFVEYPMHRFFLRECRALKKKGYEPDIVLLDWTQAVFLSGKLRAFFPKARLICVEQDVSYLKYRRFYEHTPQLLKKAVRFVKYLNIRRQELSALRRADEILVLNEKDRDLLCSDSSGCLKNIRVIVPYFDTYFDVCRADVPENDILFFGAMSRPENFKSALWFIEQVLPLLPEQFRFVIVGNNPPPELLRCNGNRVLVKGFVEDVRPFFATALCFVCPLVSGAGIKIKILEALSAAVPVITNAIGIEGIPAQRGSDCIFAETPAEYADAVRRFAADADYRRSVGDSGREFIRRRFNYEQESYVLPPAGE